MTTETPAPDAERQRFVRSQDGYGILALAEIGPLAAAPPDAAEDEPQPLAETWRLIPGLRPEFSISLSDNGRIVEIPGLRHNEMRWARSLLFEAYVKTHPQLDAAHSTHRVGEVLQYLGHYHLPHTGPRRLRCAAGSVVGGDAASLLPVHTYDAERDLHLAALWRPPGMTLPTGTYARIALCT